MTTVSKLTLSCSQVLATPPSSLYTDRPRVSINSGAFAETLRYCALRTLDPSSNRRSGGVWDAF